MSSQLIGLVISVLGAIIFIGVAVGLPALAVVALRFFKFKEHELTLEMEYRRKSQQQGVAIGQQVQGLEQRVQRLEEVLTSLDHDVRDRLGIESSAATSQCELEKEIERLVEALANGTAHEAIWSSGGALLISGAARRPRVKQQQGSSGRRLRVVVNGDALRRRLAPMLVMQHARPSGSDEAPGLVERAVDAPGFAEDHDARPSLLRVETKSDGHAAAENDCDDRSSPAQRQRIQQEEHERDGGDHAPDGQGCHGWIEPGCEEQAGNEVVHSDAVFARSIFLHIHWYGSLLTLVVAVEGAVHGGDVVRMPGRFGTACQVTKSSGLIEQRSSGSHTID